MNQKEHFITSDLKLQAFLRLMAPSLFVGINKSNVNKVTFIFENNSIINDLVNGYYEGKEFKFSPLGFATNIDIGKSLIFSDYKK
jgi:hypothetical protein